MSPDPPPARPAALRLGILRIMDLTHNISGRAECGMGKGRGGGAENLTAARGVLPQDSARPKSEKFGGGGGQGAGRQGAS